MGDVQEQGEVEETSAGNGPVTAAPAAEPVRAGPPPIQHLSVEDRLQCEVLQLRVLNAILTQAEAARALQDRTRELGEAQKKLGEQQHAIGAKYSIDFKTHIIREADGAIIPR